MSITWYHGKAEECQAFAERVAGAAPLGYLYRFDRKRYAYVIPYACQVTGDGEWATREVVELTAYQIHKPTPCGWRLASGRFVSREATKRFALPTVEEALESFVKRQERRIGIMEGRAAESRRAIEMVRPTMLAPMVAA